MAGVPLQVKVQGRDLSVNTDLGKASSAHGTKQQHNSHLRTPLDTPGGSSVVGFARSWQLLRVPGQPFTLASSSRKGVPLQVLVRGLPPALNAPVSWEPAGCRACVGGRQRGSGRHRSCTPSSCQRLWTPNGRQGKLKSHHCCPPCPHPLSGRKQLVLILLPTQTGQEQPLGAGQEPVLHLGTAAGLCHCPQQPWGTASPPKAGQCHTATRNDESPGLHPAAVQGTLLPSACRHEGR